MKEFAEGFYKSMRWKKCRKSFISIRHGIDGGLCEICRSDIGKIVHHRITLTADNICDPEVSLNHKNLQYVCQTCHNRIDHQTGRQDRNARCRFAADGQPYIKGTAPL